jgi:isopentenyl-diphosphate delta-isomerase
LIELNPPLPFSAGKHAGFIREISPTAARVEWSEYQADTNIDWITIMSGDFLRHKIMVRTCCDNLITFLESSHDAVKDLLHVVRKGQHIQLCATGNVEHSLRATGFDEINLPIVALPEAKWEDVDTNTQFCGRSFRAPLLITGMTGGIAQASMINDRLARAASAHSIPMGVGSQRIALENPNYEGIFKLKDRYPELFLIGNIGIGQLRQNTYLQACQQAVAMINADALAIHINVLQELIQVEGDRDFRGLVERIGNVAAHLSVPVIVKEVGAGLDIYTAQKLWANGIRYFDIGGAGGTSWAHIEGLRASEPMIQRRGAIFRDWGIPTAKALAALRHLLPQANLIATGGIRDGLMARKAIFAGANLAGIGLPLLRAALESEDGPKRLLESMITEYKIAYFCSGMGAVSVTST